VPPHLDVLATAKKRLQVGLESKCIEFLNGHKTEFPRSYDSLAGLIAAKPYFDLIASLRKNPADYEYLDAPQLIKHALGLAKCFPDQYVTLLYVFWEPANGQMVKEFQEHRREIVRFAQAVSGSTIRFVWLSYPELWAEWDVVAGIPWLKPHVAALKERYELDLHIRA
jgi:hypothetical protein